MRIHDKELSQRGFDRGWFLDRLILACFALAGTIGGVVAVFVCAFILGPDDAHATGGGAWWESDTFIICLALSLIFGGTVLGVLAGDRFLVAWRQGTGSEVRPVCGINRLVARGLYCKACEIYPRP